MAEDSSGKGTKDGWNKDNIDEWNERARASYEQVLQLKDQWVREGYSVIIRKGDDPNGRFRFKVNGREVTTNHVICAVNFHVKCSGT